MRIARTLSQAAGFEPSALTIGNFDGVHLGHQRLFEQVVAAARERGLRAAVLTFDPHPACVVAPARAPRLLTNIEDRCELMRQCGIEQVLILPFTPDVARLSPEDFIQQIVVGALHAKVVLVGENFRFGYKQAGDTRVLGELAKPNGYETIITGVVKCRGQIVSSSLIRKLIQGGEVSRACRFLGRPYAIDGVVVHGRGIGAKQTVPTLNLRTSAEVLPRNGVYITRTNSRWNSITNVGLRPTFGASDELSIETFLLGPFEEPAPEKIRLEFLRRIRDERKFENSEALKAQILRDAASAQSYFRRSAAWTRM